MLELYSLSGSTTMALSWRLQSGNRMLKESVVNGARGDIEEPTNAHHGPVFNGIPWTVYSVDRRVVVCDLRRLKPEHSSRQPNKTLGSSSTGRLAKYEPDL